MRLAHFLLALIVLTSLTLEASVPVKAANTHTITLYAHSDGNSLILNTIPQWSGRKSADASSTMTFKLNPVLGGSVRISGAVFATIYLTSSARQDGTLVTRLSELKSTGEEIPVTPSMQVPVSLDSRIVSPYYLGVGSISYTFDRGSSIELQVHVNSTSTSAIPYLLWDDIRNPTSVSIPAEPISAQLKLSADKQQYGRIIQADSTNSAKVNFFANVTDAFGISHVKNASISFTSSNGTLKEEPNSIGVSPYLRSYASTVKLGVGLWQVNLDLHDRTEQEYTFSDVIWVARFFNVKISVVDSSQNGMPLQDAILNVTSLQGVTWTSKTDPQGTAMMTLPSTDIVGPLNLTLTWHNVQTNIGQLTVIGDSTLNLPMPLYEVTVRLSIYRIPVPNASVILLQGKNTVAKIASSAGGVASFTQVPAGNYTVRVEYLLSQFDRVLNVKGNTVAAIDLPLPHINEIFIAVAALAGTITVTVATRRRRKLYPQNFNYFNSLTTGGLPSACFTVIAGNSGSGKTVLLESLAADHLKSGGACLYITNTEYPAKIRESMSMLGMPAQEAVESGKFLFIDSYSALGGAASTEESSISSHTDLTGLGMEISKGLARLGKGADVYLDSLTPLLNALRLDYLLSFLQSIAAKVKANDGRLCVTVGTSIERSDITKLEETSDCVVETELQEVRSGQRRRLRIKKLRAKGYVDKWTTFIIETGKGIVFLTRTKPNSKRETQTPTKSH